MQRLAGRRKARNGAAHSNSGAGIPHTNADRLAGSQVAPPVEEDHTIFKGRIDGLGTERHGTRRPGISSHVHPRLRDTPYVAGANSRRIISNKNFRHYSPVSVDGGKTPRRFIKCVVTIGRMPCDKSLNKTSAGKYLATKIPLVKHVVDAVCQSPGSRTVSLRHYRHIGEICCAHETSSKTPR